MFVPGHVGAGVSGPFCGIRLYCQQIKLNAMPHIWLERTFCEMPIHKVVWLSKYLSQSYIHIQFELIHRLKRRQENKGPVISNYLLQLVPVFLDNTLR